MTETDFALADRLTQRRARFTTVMAIIFIATQSASIGPDMALSRAQTIQGGAWVIWSIALLTLLATGGGYLRSKAVRDLMNDETTRDNRNRALILGFWVAIVTALLIYAISFYEVFGAKEALRVVLTTSIAAALLRFGALERRSLKGE
jgi:hypothetical protein